MTFQTPPPKRKLSVIFFISFVTFWRVASFCKRKTKNIFPFIFPTGRTITNATTSVKCHPGQGTISAGNFSLVPCTWFARMRASRKRKRNNRATLSAYFSGRISCGGLEFPLPCGVGMSQCGAFMLNRLRVAFVKRTPTTHDGGVSKMFVWEERK